ncbi:hypothetical protein N7447_005032, partial [Penicillium robsamsonii]|uniref:uncharacterized protein n=1 Tax=Penicillium robsamsonii TaxID=1792511 RepID=UPI002546AC31
QLGERATEVRKVAGSIPARPIIVFVFLPWTLHKTSQHGTIAQLGERATEVRKVAGSIPARPIYFLYILIIQLIKLTLHTQHAMYIEHA